MSRAKVTFKQMLPDMPGMGDDEHVVSRVLFTLEIDGEESGGFTQVELTHERTGDMRTVPIEVGSLTRYGFLSNYEVFCEGAKEAYRETLHETFGDNIPQQIRGVGFDNLNKVIEFEIEESIEL